MGAAVRRPLLVGLAVTALALAGAALALRLEPSAATDTLVGRSSDAYAATQTEHQRFGEDAVIVLIKGPVSKLVLTSDLERLLGLEGCISGNAPAGVTPRGGANGPCAQLAKTKPVKVVFGPATFINESIRQITRRFQAHTQQGTGQARTAGGAACRRALAKGYGTARGERARTPARWRVPRPCGTAVGGRALRAG